MSHNHPIHDDEKRFTIDATTRVVKMPETTRPVLIQYDHNSEHITFECDRFVEGHDLALCDRVEVHYNNIGDSRRVNRGVYPVEDLKIHDSDESKVVFTWIVSQNATQYSGILAFVVCFYCTNDGDIYYRWNTNINRDLVVSEGIDNAEAVGNIYADVLEMWKQDLFGIGDTEEARMLQVSQQQQDAIAAKGLRTLDTIPDEYMDYETFADSKADANLVTWVYPSSPPNAFIFANNKMIIPAEVGAIRVFIGKRQYSFTNAEIAEQLGDRAVLNDKGDVEITFDTSADPWYITIKNDGSTLSSSAEGNLPSGYSMLGGQRYGRYWGPLFSTLPYDTANELNFLHGEIIFTNSGRITSISNGVVTFSKGANGIYRFTRGKRYHYDFSSLATDLPNNSSIVNNVATITVPDQYVLVWTSLNKLEIIPRSSERPGDTLLLGNYYTNHYGLFVHKYAYDNTYNIGELTSKTEKVLDIFNSPPLDDTWNWETKCREYSALFNNTNNVESFLFFTDPHLVEATGWEDECRDYISYINKVYNSTPTSFCVCGGDWIGNSDTMDMACYKLGFIDGFMRSMFDKVHLVVGNHDTNYQGKLTADSENWTGMLTNNTIRNLWYREQGCAYYRFEGRLSDYYILDTQLDSSAMDEYLWAELDWLAKSLKERNSQHAAIFQHIVYYHEQNKSQFAINEGALLEAYNAHTQVTLNGVTYDFTSCTGHVDYILAGHTHADYITDVGGVPAIITTNVRYGNVPTFDLCLADYDNEVLRLIRVGTGESRDVSFA